MSGRFYDVTNDRGCARGNMGGGDSMNPRHALVRKRCRKPCAPVLWVSRYNRPFFLNFDVAITCNRAQHLLALARKVEQGGLKWLRNLAQAGSFLLPSFWQWSPFILFGICNGSRSCSPRSIILKWLPRCRIFRRAPN